MDQATPPPGRRHLKTLSLSSPSPNRSSLSRSQNGGAPAFNGASPSNPLRLSLRNNAPAADAILEDAPWTAPVPSESGNSSGEPQGTGQGTLPVTPVRGAYHQRRGDSDRKSLNRLSLSSDISSASSSRSYRSSWGSSQGGSVDFGAGSSGDTPAHRDLAALKKSRRQSSISYTRSDASNFSPAASPIATRNEAPTASPLTPARSVSLASSRSSRADDISTSQANSPDSPNTSQSGATTPNKSSATPATLVEQHADLLSFIAKKERKCLDLREELKRHEEELKALKKKWESIVARDQQQSSLQSGSTSTPSISPNIGGNKSPRQPSSPNTQATALDPSSRGDHEQPLSMGVGDVTAARKWMGGWMKQGMAGVAGIMEGMSEPRSSSDLGTVREEEEGEDQENRLSAHASSSTKSPPLFSSQSSNNNNNALLVNVEQEQQGERDFKSLLENKHAKRRSTFDLNWGDAFKRSQKAALGFVETFERTIADSLILPPLEDEDQQQHGGSNDLMFSPASPSLAPPSPTPSGSRSKTPSPRHSPSMRHQSSFNWDAALDDSGADISSTPLQASAPQQQAKSSEARVKAARQKHMQRHSMFATNAAQPSKDPEPQTAGSPETDGWGW